MLSSVSKRLVAAFDSDRRKFVVSQEAPFMALLGTMNINRQQTRSCVLSPHVFHFHPPGAQNLEQSQAHSTSLHACKNLFEPKYLPRQKITYLSLFPHWGWGFLLSHNTHYINFSQALYQSKHRAVEGCRRWLRVAGTWTSTWCDNLFVL